MAFGRFVENLFKAPSAQPGSSTPEVVDTPQSSVDADQVAAARALDKLRAWVRRSGGELPPLLISRLSQIDDLLRVVLATIDEKSASTEQQVLLAAMIGDYIPTPLHAFLALPDEDREADSRATTLFAEQLGILEETIRDLLNQIRIGAIAELSTHGRFLNDKFNAPTLTLDGR